MHINYGDFKVLTDHQRPNSTLVSCHSSTSMFIICKGGEPKGSTTVVLFWGIEAKGVLLLRTAQFVLGSHGLAHHEFVL